MDEQRARQLLTEERERFERMRDGQQQEHDWQDDVDGGEQPADAAANLHLQQVEEGITERAEERLAEVDEALRRLDEGRYGTCAVCGEQIPDERLEERPAADRCVDHADSPAA